MLNRIRTLNPKLLYALIIIFALFLLIIIGSFTVKHVLKSVLIKIASSELDKKVEIKGSFNISYSLSPSIHISGLKLINDDSWNQREFARIGSAFLKLELMPLLSDRIYINKISIEDVEVNLEKDAEGNKNWELVKDPEKEKDEKADGPPHFPEDIAADQIRLVNLAVNYYEPESENKEIIRVESSEITFPVDSNLNASLEGKYHGNPIGLKLSAGSYQQLRDTEVYWPFDIKLHISTNEFNAQGKLKSPLKPEDLDLHLNMMSKDLHLDPLFFILANYYAESLKNYRGELGDINLSFIGSGKSIEELITSSNTELTLKNLRVSKLNKDNKKFEHFASLGSAQINMNQNEISVARINGDITGYPLSIDASGCSKSTFFNGDDCGLRLEGKFGTSDLDIKGDITRFGNDLNASIKSSLDIPDIEQLEFIFDIPEGYNLPTKLSIEFIKNGTDILVKDFNINIGQSDLRGELEKTYTNDRINFKIILLSSTLNLNEIMAIIPKKDDKKDTDHSLKVPIFPKNLSSFDAYTKIDLKNVIYYDLKIKNILIDSQIKDNIEKRSEFTVNTINGEFSGRYDLDISSDVPVAKFNINSRNTDLGKIAKNLRFADNVNLNTEKLDLELIIKGSTLDEIIRYSSLIADIENGVLKVEDLNTMKNFDIFVKKGNLDLYADKPITLSIDGSINKQNVKISLSTNHIIRSFARLEKGKIPINLSLDFADSEIDLDGFAQFPLNRKTSELQIRIKGKKLSDYNKLLGISLPDKGPYSFFSDFMVTDHGYNLENIVLDYADTALKGNLIIDTSKPTPYFGTNAEFELLDIDDLFSSRLKHHKKEKKHADDTDRDIKLPDLSSFDSNFNFTVKEILLSEENIGNAELIGKVENGKLSVDEASLNILNGEAKFEIEGQETDDQFELSVEGHLDNYDYGPLARMLQPETKMSGKMNWILNIDTKGDTLKKLDDNLSGELKLNIRPHRLGAGKINLWAVGMFHNLIPRWFQHEEDKPKINCLMGKLKAKNGILRPDDLNLDTTNVRVKIVGNINMANDKINLVFKPIPKKAQLFSLGIPIRVVGTFENYHIITDPSNVGWYVARLTYSGMEQIMRFFGKDYLPEDGNDICDKDLKDI